MRMLCNPKIHGVLSSIFELMITHGFDYFSPASMSEALALLSEHKERNPKLLAGGQSLLPIMKLGLSTPEVIIDLKHIPSLSYIKTDNDELRIGALTRHSDIAISDDMELVCPMLRSAAKGIGHQLIRARGTIGGSLMHCDPRADYLIVLLALDARIVASSLKGNRIVRISDFVRGPFETTLEPEEILTEIVIPRERDAGREIFQKYEFGHGDFGLAFVAIRVWIAERVCKKSVIYVSGIEDSPTRLVNLESYLENRPVDDDYDQEINACVSKLGSGTVLESETAFRRKLVSTLLKRGLSDAFSKGE